MNIVWKTLEQFCEFINAVQLQPHIVKLYRIKGELIVMFWFSRSQVEMQRDAEGVGYNRVKGGVQPENHA